MNKPPDKYFDAVGRLVLCPVAVAAAGKTSNKFAERWEKRHAEAKKPASKTFSDSTGELQDLGASLRFLGNKMQDEIRNYVSAIIDMARSFREYGQERAASDLAVPLQDVSEEFFMTCASQRGFDYSAIYPTPPFTMAMLTLARTFEDEYPKWSDMRWSYIVEVHSLAITRANKLLCPNFLEAPNLKDL